MNIEIFPTQLGGTVKAIPSKSQAHRGLICAALAGLGSENLALSGIECDGSSKDIEATKNCLAAIRSAPECTPCVLYPGESGSTFRFLLPIVAALGLNAVFRLEGRLHERPVSPLYEELERHGCFMSPQGSRDFEISGQLTHGEYTLDAGVSSQFISGLLFALPLLKGDSVGPGDSVDPGDSVLRLSGKMESAPYVELTVEMLRRFGIEIGFKNNSFHICGNQVYRSSGVVKIEGDWSNAAFWLCAGAVSRTPITCTGLNLQSKQGDRAVLKILERFGARVECRDDSVTVSGGDLRGIEIDARDIPDLVPILSVVAVAARGVTRIYNAGRLRIKESDRLASVTDVLNRLGAKVIEKEDGLEIHGGIPLKGGTVSSWNDHRIAMSAAIAASLLCTDSVVIEGAEAVDKSYPGFFNDLRTLKIK